MPGTAGVGTAGFLLPFFFKGPAFRCSKSRSATHRLFSPDLPIHRPSVIRVLYRPPVRFLKSRRCADDPKLGSRLIHGLEGNPSSPYSLFNGAH